VHHGDGGGFVMFFKSLAPEITWKRKGQLLQNSMKTNYNNS
jgi:hypothetical protein